jgi:hypothetical protein
MNAKKAILEIEKLSPQKGDIIVVYVDNNDNTIVKRDDLLMWCEVFKSCDFNGEIVVVAKRDVRKIECVKKADEAELSVKLLPNVYGEEK